MTDVTVQESGVGSSIIDELCAYVCCDGFSEICLGWVKGNPQVEHFWHKNRLHETGRIFDMDDFDVIEARRNIVVPVNNENIDDAAMVHSISWQESHRSFCNEDFISKHSIDHQQEYINNKMNNGSRFFMLCEEIPVAVVSVTGNLIEDLYVLPDYQNRGYGSMLLEYVISMIKHQNLTPTLWILENNDGAKRLYERKGFVPSGNTNAITGKLSELEYKKER